MVQDQWEYIGDGVYLMFDGYGFWLHANSHKDPTDIIYLESEVTIKLVKMITGEDS